MFLGYAELFPKEIINCASLKTSVVQVSTCFCFLLYFALKYFKIVDIFGNVIDSMLCRSRNLARHYLESQRLDLGQKSFKPPTGQRPRCLDAPISDVAIRPP